MRQQGSIRRYLALVALAAAFAIPACEDDPAPAPAPRNLSIVSGDDQYSKKGTELEAPIVVQVVLDDGAPGAGVPVTFQVVEGGGSLSRSTVNANASGLASVRWTLGPDTGPQRVRATVAGNSALSVQLDATSSEFYCPEEDPVFSRKFFPQQDLFLFTPRSSLAADAAIVQVSPSFPGSFDGVLFLEFVGGVLLNIVRDCAFSASGDFYLAWTTGSAVHEVVKIEGDGSATHFASLQSSFGSEIAFLPGGVLAGCDEFGPFTVGCRDTLTRYEDATFGGIAPDAANNDAMAVDPASGDLYFIQIENRRLRRLPLDGYTQTAPSVDVATLDIEEAYGARGMVIDTDGSVFILVDSDDDATKRIVKVTAAGVKTTVVDFFAERGAGDLAGEQSDLAIDRSIRFLYTMDTLNNVVLIYDIAGATFGQPLVSSGDPGAASDGSVGERVGIAVLP